MRSTLRGHVLVIAAAVIGLAVASPAFAHSTLLGTQPRAGAVVMESPEEVLLRFNEPVETALGSIRVFDGEGNRVDLEEIMRPSGPLVTVGLEDGLPQGTYTVAWRVISADSDPINGAFVFHVGEPGADAEGLVGELEGTPLATDVAFTTGRGFEFAFLLLVVGGMAALAYPLRTAAAPVQRRLGLVLAIAAVGLAIFALLAIFLQGGTAAGLSLRDTFTWSTFSAIADTRYGIVSLIQTGLALAVLGVAFLVRRTAGAIPAALLAVGVVLGLALAVTPPFAGHASTTGTLAVVSDFAHVAAAAAWVGGLGFVVAALLLAREDRWPLATRAVPRFSTMAVGAVAVLIVAGTIHGYLQVLTWSALWETRYGILLLAKIGLVLPLLGLGAYNNRYAVPRLRDEVAEPREQRRFLYAAGTELVIMAAIVGVTAVLVNTGQPRMMAEHAGGGAVMLDFGEFEAEVMVEPGVAGRNEIVVMLGEHEDGEQTEAEAVSISASLPEQEIGPLVFEAEPMEDEPGAYMVEEADLNIAGEWELTLEIRLTEFDVVTETATFMLEERGN